MRLFPKIPGSVTFWQKLSMFSVMFVGGCLLATRFFKDSPETVESAENLMWFGFAGLILGWVMQFIKRKKE